MSVTQIPPAGQSERGAGLIEIVIAMFLIAILALSFLPLVISSMKLSSENVTIATASQMVNEQMDIARGLGPTCSTLNQYATETIGLLVTDPRGTVLQMRRYLPDPCPTTYPAAVRFTATVTVQGSSEVLAEATTRIFLDSATGPTTP